MRRDFHRPVIFIALLLLVSFSFQLPIPLPVKANGSPPYHNGIETYEWDPALYSEWNYRVRVTVTEPGVANRTNEPINVYLEFPSGFAREKNIHVKFYNGTWHLVPYQVWNITGGAPYLDSCTITFLSNITKGDTVHYYVYFSGSSSPTAPDSPTYVEWDNATGSITAASYQATMNLDYGFLDDFIVNGYDLIGEGYTWQYPWPGGSVEAGIITDGRDPWRDEITGNEDTATLDNSLSISGPVFTRLVINKTTDEWPDGSDIDRVWTFYPNYFTLEVRYDRVNNGEARLVIYGRSYHNGGYPINGATAVENYTRYGTEYVREAAIDGYGGNEYMQDYDVPNPRWFGVYENGQYAYSCVPTQDSDINAIHYYDRADYYSNPRLYGAMGWGYYVQYGVLPYGLEAKLFYFPHGPQSDYSGHEFAINDHARVNNPVTETNGSIEYRIFNLLEVEAVDYDGNYISNLKVQLFNATPFERNETTDEGIAEFDDLESGVYNMGFWYTIDSTEYQVPANITGLNFNPGYIRKSTIIANCSLRTLHMYLQDEDYGLPLYDYTLRLNSTTNSIDINGTTDENGNHNFTLLTYQSDFYNISVYDPDDIEQTAEPKGVNLNSSALGIPPTLVLTLIPPLNVTTLTHEYSNGSIDYASTIQTGRLITPTYAEVYYGDNVTFSISFIDVTYDNNSIHDANESLWELYLAGDLWDWGDATYNSTTGMYTISLNTSDYQWNTEYTLKIHFEREDCIIPANKTIVLMIKSWDTTFTSVPYIDTMQIYYVDRENLTVSLNYVDMLSASHFLTDTENFSASILGVGPLTIANSSFSPDGDSIKFDFNLSSLVDLGSFVLTINANHTHYEYKQLSITLNLIPAPTYVETWDSSPDFEVSVAGTDILRAAMGENLTVSLWARSNATAMFDIGNVTGETGTYLLPWEDPIDFSETSSPGIYAFNVSTSNCPNPEDYSIIVLIFKQYYESIQISIPLQVIAAWDADIAVTMLNYTVPWGDNVSMLVKYDCSLAPRNGMNLTEADLTLDWDSNYWNFTELGGGLYRIDLNTSANSPEFPYNPEINASKQFYQTASSDASFYPRRIITNVEQVYLNRTVEQGQPVLLVVRLKDLDHEKILTSATVTYSITGTNVTGILEFVPGDNFFRAEIATEGLEPSDYYIELTVDFDPVGGFEVYSTPSGVTIGITILTPTPFFLLAILFVIGITAVPAAYGGIRYYRWAKLPATVKKLVRTMGSISKNKEVREEIVATREALIDQRTAELFVSAGISAPEVELMPAPEKIELVPEVAEIREVVYGKFPDLPDGEKEAMVAELLGMEPTERDQFVKTLVGARVEDQIKIEEEILTEALTEEEIEEILEDLIQKQIITPDEKLILIEELKHLPPEERKEFLEKLKKS
ncbi:MAG: hypothetical protein ACFE7I_09285 [Candidatus Hodarchaeota archaeon]